MHCRCLLVQLLNPLSLLFLDQEETPVHRAHYLLAPAHQCKQPLLERTHPEQRHNTPKRVFPLCQHMLHRTGHQHVSI